MIIMMLLLVILMVLLDEHDKFGLIDRVNKKGYRYRQKRKSFQQADRGCNTNWLSWIQPDLIQKGVKRYHFSDFFFFFFFKFYHK